ncbi:MAG: PAS domain S-box protein, partial [Anaerolineae bacterium]|nr:PAS domain S-box protein [Anaerolineae bacterium]
MNLQFLSVLHSLPLLLATAGLLLIMGYVWRRADGPAVRVFLAFALATVLWLLCSVLASFSQDVTLFLFWIRLSLLGATTVPVVWLGFVWRYLDHPGHVLPRIVLGLLAFPLLTNLIAWTNDLHHLYWVTVEPVMTGDGLTGFNQVYGPWPLLQNLYVLVLLVLAGGLLVREFVRGGADRRQIGLLLLAWLLPLGTGLLTTASPSDSLDYALLPFVVAVSLVLTAWSVYNFGPLNVCPTAHNTVIESLEDGVLLIDRRNRITEVNPAATRLTGIAVEELVGQDVDALLSHWLPLAEDISGVWQGGELLVIRAGDARRFLSMRQSAIRDQQGREDGRAIVLADVTARRAVEEDLRKFSRAVEQSASIAIITNTNGEIEYVNPRFTAITGYTLDDVRGENPRLLKSGETDDDTYSRLWGALSKGGQWQGELHNRKKNGDLYWVSATMSPIFDSRGNVTHFI